MSAETRFYQLADFTGMDLAVDGTVVTGSGAFNVDFGIGRLKLAAEIRYGITDEARHHAILLIAVGVALGLVVFCDLHTKQVKLGIFDRTGLLLKSMFSGGPTETAYLEEKLSSAKPRYFTGIMGSSFQAVPSV